MKFYHYKKEGGGITGFSRPDGAAWWGGGGNLVLTMHVCVCPKLKDMGPFSASSE